MDLLKSMGGVSPQRKDRLIRIRRSIESSFMFEEEARSKPVNASSLKRLYNLDSLWIKEGGKIKKLGSADYTREIALYNTMRAKYEGLRGIQVQVGGIKYHVMEKGGKLYAFSTPLDLTSMEALLAIGEIEGSLEGKKIFVGSNTNITE